MDYTVDGIVFVLGLQDDNPTGPVVTLTSANPAIIELIGAEGLTFNSAVPISVAEGLADVLAGSVTS